MNIPIEHIQWTQSEEVNQDDITSLADSIKSKGLLHAVTVHNVNDSESNSMYKLVTGEKRLRACISLGWKEIDCKVLESDDGIIEIKIHENLKRSNLSWYEQAILISQLHELRQKDKGLRRAGNPHGVKEGWSIQDTARELGLSLGLTAEMIQVEKMVKNDPSLKNIKDRRTALRVSKLKRQIQDAEQDSGRTIVEIPINEVLLGESQDILHRFPPGVFDAVITDPPWMEFKDDKLIKDQHTESVFIEVHRVMKSNTLMYMFVGTDDFMRYREFLPSIGFQVQKYPMIWYKKNQISMGTRPWEYNRDCELILLAAKGTGACRTTSTPRSSLFDFPVVPPSQLIHPNQKPIKLIKSIITDCTHDGGLILDPFAGSGVVGEACRSENRKYVLIEKDKTYFDQIQEHLK